MFSSVLVFALAAGAANAALVPTAPGPNQSFKEGGDCTMSWNLDTTGKWTSFNVDLMSGSNLAMQPVTNVFKGRDGTKGDTTYSWKCPSVTPNSAIYFYQFTQTGADTTWTTRFTIASASGETTPPANLVQPGGAAIPWGIGSLKGAAASIANASSVTPTTGSNATVSTPPATGSNSTNPATAPPGGNLTAAFNNTPAIGSTPKQSTSSTSTTSPSSNQVSTPAVTSSRTSTTTSPSSDATSLITSKIVMFLLAVVSLIVVA